MYIEDVIEKEKLKDAIKFLNHYLNEEVYTKKCIESHEIAIRCIKEKLNILETNKSVY